VAKVPLHSTTIRKKLLSLKHLNRECGNNQKAMGNQTSKIGNIWHQKIPQTWLQETVFKETDLSFTLRF